MVLKGVIMRFNEAAGKAQQHAIDLKITKKISDAWVELSFKNLATGIYISDKAEVSASNFPIDTLSNDWGIIK